MLKERLEIFDIMGYASLGPNLVIFEEADYTRVFPENKIYRLIGLNILTRELTVINPGKGYEIMWMGQLGHSIAPILRPMTDLNKTIIHADEHFVPLERIQQLSKEVEFDESGLQILFQRFISKASRNR